MKDLTVGKESKLIFQFTIPMLLGNLFQQLYNVVDSVIVGHFLGKQALAAVGASFPIIFALIALVVGITTGSTVIIAQYYGAKQPEKIRKAIGTMYIFLFWASLCLTLLGINYSEAIFRLIQLPEDIMPQAITYLNVYLGGLIFFFGYNGVSAFLRGMGDSKTPLYFLVISTLLNIVLDLLFILVFKWGIAGAAIATIISQAVAFIAAIWYLNRTSEIMRFSFSELKFDFDIFIKSIRIGLPTGLQQLFVSLGMMALFGIVNTFGTNVIAAYSVAARIETMAIMPAMNFSMAITTFVGQNLGAQKYDRVKIGVLSTLGMSTGLSMVISLIVVVFRDTLMRLFTSDPMVIEAGGTYLLITGLFYMFFNAMFVFNGVMRGAGDTIIPMFITLFSLWVIRIPFAWFLSARIGEIGIWWAIPIAWFIGMSFSGIYYRTGRWKKKVLVKSTVFPKVALAPESTLNDN